LDILEVVEVLRTSRIPVAPVSEPVSVAPHAPPQSRAAEVLETSRLPAVMIAPRSSLPSMPNMPVAPSGHHPSSIAPLALDVSPPPRASYADQASAAAFYRPLPADPRESTIEIARAAGIPSRASRIVVYTASVAGMCLVAGILGVMLGYSHGPAKSAQPISLAGTGPVAAAPAAPAAAGAPAPRVAVVTSAHEEITEGPILVPGKDAASIAEPSGESFATATPTPTPVVVAPAPPPAPAPRTAPAAPASRPAAPVTRSSSSSSSSSSAGASNTGVLRLPATVSGVLIDGVPHKAGGGGLVVTCGRHTVKAPGHPSRLIIIPCGGSASL
ncbi:MAG: hypothetical protein QOI41_7520, partial [Myxococcales bacterium]|nr:hypothetical protein [Myxococcales bacterium]